MKKPAFQLGSLNSPTAGRLKERQPTIRLPHGETGGVRAYKAMILGTVRVAVHCACLSFQLFVFHI